MLTREQQIAQFDLTSQVGLATVHIELLNNAIQSFYKPQKDRIWYNRGDLQAIQLLIRLRDKAEKEQAAIRGFRLNWVYLIPKRHQSHN
jgi:hypothetical protein